MPPALQAWSPANREGLQLSHHVKEDETKRGESEGGVARGKTLETLKHNLVVSRTPKVLPS